jgi:DNA invertase Pin-like site-specific DNA recombinase
VVWRLDRLGRSIEDLIGWRTRLEQDGVGFKSLQKTIDRTSIGGKLTFHLLAGLAAFERQLIQERTHAGLRAARVRGRVGGRPKALTARQQKRAVELYQEKRLVVNETCKMMGISKPTLYAHVRQAQSSP